MHSDSILEKDWEMPNYFENNVS